MSITLSWTNYNQSATDTLVYRSETPISEGSPGTLIATVPYGTFKYVDTVPILGVTYYYQLEFKLGTESIKGTPFSVKAGTDYGPGPSRLVAGNAIMGYFGLIPTIELGFNFSDFGGGTFVNVHKLMRNGKVIYTPGILSSSATPDVIRSRKIFNTGVSPALGIPADSADGAQIVVNGRKFNPRVTKFFDDANADLTIANYGANMASTMPLGKSEFLDLQGLFTRNTTDNLRRAAFRIQNLSTMPVVSASLKVFCCDWMPPTRGSYVSANNLDLTSSFATKIVAQTTSSTGTCIPVLEYVGAQ